MKVSRSQAGVGLFYTALTVFWAWLSASGRTEGNANYLFSFLFGLIPLVGGAIAMKGAGLWGRFRSAMGRGVFFLGLGLMLWGAGEMIWSYYNFFTGEAAPYPSWADLGFGPSIFFWIIGVIYLSKASGAKFGLRSLPTKIAAALASLVMMGVSYYMLVVVARDGVVSSGGGHLKVLLDIIYPLGDLLALTVAVLIYTLSRKYLGGIYRLPILTILLGLAVMYLGDFTFSYTTTVGSYYNGNWGDLVLATGLALLSFGTLGLCAHPQASGVKRGNA